MAIPIGGECNLLNHGSKVVLLLTSSSYFDVYRALERKTLTSSDQKLSSLWSKGGKTKYVDSYRAVVGIQATDGSGNL